MKVSKYNFILYNGDYGYWYNAFSGLFFRLSKQLSIKIEGLLNDIELIKLEVASLYEKLCTGGFIVSDEIDELDLIRRKHTDAVNAKDYFLIIMPTLNCNFSCWYCIQEHTPSIMSLKTFEALKKHIDFMITKHKISSLNIDWFGGEPFMYFKQIIEPFSKYVIETCKLHNIPFVNTSTTNGYFINEAISSRLSDLKFTQFQITLDGEKEFHDKVKFMKGCVSAFEHVLTNINTILLKNPGITIFLRINYTHKTLSRKIVSEVNKFISIDNRSRVVVTPKKVWQESVDKNFNEVITGVLNDFESSGYVVSRHDVVSNFMPCYVNKKYYNAINYNGNVVKCTACDDIHKDNAKGKLLDNGHIVWKDEFDLKCQTATYENEKCLNCNKLPICMGLCPRDYLSGHTHCKNDVMDEDFETGLLNYLTHQYL
jgi:radical SAM domain protein